MRALHANYSPLVTFSNCCEEILRWSPQQPVLLDEGVLIVRSACTIKTDNVARKEFKHVFCHKNGMYENVCRLEFVKAKVLKWKDAFHNQFLGESFVVSGQRHALQHDDAITRMQISSRFYIQRMKYLYLV